MLCLFSVVEAWNSKMNTINKELEMAWEVIESTGIHLFLTGKAGTGKTTFLRELKKRSPKRMAVLAPTGIAAINAGGVTIHSFFQLPFAPFLPNEAGISAQMKYQFSKEKRSIIRSLDLLVIDEISMVRADLLDAIDDVLRKIRKNSKPFGGVQLLMIGDLQQLPPVVPPKDQQLLSRHYTSFYFFGSDVLQNRTNQTDNKMRFLTIELQKVYRQSDEKFLSVLNKIRTNSADKEVLRELNKRYFPQFNPSEEEGYIRLVTHNYQAQQFNEAKLQELGGKAYHYASSIKNNFPASMYPAEENLALKVGAQIMFLKNDISVEKRFYNGKLGRVTGLTSKEIFVICDGVDKPFQLEKMEWTNAKYTLNQQTNEIVEEIEGSFQQYPIRLAWAITIHKSQGLTFEKAIIDAAASFAHGQVYVALSRCKTLEGMVLTSRLGNDSIISDREIDQFVLSSERNKPSEEELNELKKRYYLEMLLELFGMQELLYKVSYVCRIFEEHLYTTYPELTKSYRATIDGYKSRNNRVFTAFHNQLIQLVQATEEPEYDDYFQERVKKGAAYFEKELTTYLHTLLKKTHVEIDNKVTKKLFEREFGDFKELLSVKLETLQQTSRDGFSVMAYLKRKSKAAIEAEVQNDRAMKKTITKVEVSTDIKDRELYEALKRWRQEQAKKMNKPSYCVMKQQTLIAISNHKPMSQSELLAMPGFGKVSFSKYGAAIIDIIECTSGVSKDAQLF